MIARHAQCCIVGSKVFGTHCFCHFGYVSSTRLSGTRFLVRDFWLVERLSSGFSPLSIVTRTVNRWRHSVARFHCIYGHGSVLKLGKRISAELLLGKMHILSKCIHMLAVLYRHAPTTLSPGSDNKYCTHASTYYIIQNETLHNMFAALDVLFRVI
jgi:hypothetical protein